MPQEANNAQEIVIVGAGPTGLALAAELHRLGGSALVVDRQAEGANTSRAAVVHARTLEALEPLGVTSELVEYGLEVPTFRVRDRDSVLMRVEFGELPTQFPYALMCPQDHTEMILLNRLEALGGAVSRPREVTRVRADADGVEIDGAGDAEASVHARWLIGCDGAHSVVRESAGIAFEGGAYDEGFALADVHMDWPIGRDEVSLFFSPAGLLVVAPLPENRFRIVATALDAPRQPDIPYMQQVLDERGLTREQGRIHDIVWGSAFHIQHRLATQLRKRRVLICGDAAHVHSPAGGQGMNTGIQDAVSLAAPLLHALRTGDETGLQAWADRRHRIAKDVVNLTDRMTRAGALKTGAARTLRNAVVSLVGHIPGVPDRIALQLSELENR